MMDMSGFMIWNLFVSIIINRIFLFIADEIDFRSGVVVYLSLSR